MLRQEDARLLTGRGCCSDDFTLEGQAYARFVRSPHAHARIRRIDAAVAREVPGVIAVLTGDDAIADGLAPIPHRPVPTNPHEFPLAGRDGSDVFVAPHPTLPADTVLFVGEPVAMVIASADMLPAFTTAISEVPSTSNPLGLRGGGEGGTTPALGAVVNAIVDALAGLGVEHVEMPATPERVWSAIQAARASTP
ncbi:MAG TPA: hypothetical protein VMS64_31920 [Candidatus Methylomirabilis sp.]|nr:hypothetical protein [Candidatus Methylomirabilis sp.]